MSSVKTPEDAGAPESARPGVRRSLVARLLVAFALFCGCGGASPRAARIRTVDPRAVESCVYVGDVHGDVPGTLGGGLDGAKVEAQEEAAGKGATHVVWVGVDSREAEAYGRAYRCEEP